MSAIIISYVEEGQGEQCDYEVNMISLDFRVWFAVPAMKHSKTLVRVAAWLRTLMKWTHGNLVKKRLGGQAPGAEKATGIKNEATNVRRTGPPHPQKVGLLDTSPHILSEIGV